MGLFGNSGPFGSERSPYATPGIGEGLPQGPMGPDINAALSQNAMQAKPKRDWGQFAADALSGFLAAQGSPIGVAGVQSMQQRHTDRLRQRMEEMQAEREERQFRDRYAWQRQYDMQNPRPTAPYRWEANNGSLMELGPDGQPRVAYQDPTPKINWIQVKDPVTNELRIIPMGPQGPMGGAPQTGEDEWEMLDDEGGAGPAAAPAGFP